MRAARPRDVRAGRARVPHPARGDHPARRPPGGACAAAPTSWASPTAPARPTRRRCCCAARHCAARSSCARWPSSAGCAGGSCCCSASRSSGSRAPRSACRSCSRRISARCEPFFRQIHFNVKDSSTIDSIEKVLHAKSSTLNLIAFGHRPLRPAADPRGHRAVVAQAVGRVRRRRRHHRCSSRSRSTRSSRRPPGSRSSCCDQHRRGAVPAAVQAPVRPARRPPRLRGVAARGVAARGGGLLARRRPERARRRSGRTTHRT